MLASLAICALLSYPPIQVPNQARQCIGTHFGVAAKPEGEEMFLGPLRQQIQAGVTGFAMSFAWDETEPSPVKLETKTVTDNMGIGNLFGAKILVTIKTVDTLVDRRPVELRKKAWDDPELLQRWSNYLGNISSKFSERVAWVSLGNEVDSYFASRPNEVAAYKKFLEVGRRSLMDGRPGLTVGVTTSHDGFVKNPQLVTSLQQPFSTVFQTYYAIRDDFSVKATSEVKGDFANMAKLAGNRPIVLQEFGMPASESLGSSEDLQAAFVREALREIKARPNFVFASYFIQYDFLPPILDALTGYYGIPDDRFRAFLGTLGLRKNDGTPRKAWKAFREMLAPQD